MVSENLVESRIQEFKDAILEGVNGLVRAAQIYVQAIDDDPSCRERFRERCSDWVPDSAWAGFEAVGRKWMHPRLILGGIGDQRKARLIRKLPYSLQEQVFDGERFPLLVSNGDHINVSMEDATIDQARQLCAGNHIRSLAEQRAYVESMSSSLSEALPEPMPYTICGGKVHFRKGVTLNRAEVKRLLQDM